MTAELKDQILDLMERGIEPLSTDQIARHTATRTTPFPPMSHARTKRLAAIGAGVAAAACAAAVVAAQVGGATARSENQAHRAHTALTAAMVEHMAAASRLALARYGRAVVHTRSTSDGVVQETTVDDITFSGKNWNDAFSETTPALDGQPANTQSAINRVVDGQAYDYFVANHGLAWYHVTGPTAVHNMPISDPRKLLSELAPSAQFVKVGSGSIDGVAVEHLRATALKGVPDIPLAYLGAGGRLTALDVWVDGKGVVRQMSLSTTQYVHVGASTLGDVLRHLPKNVKIVGAEHLAKTALVRAWFYIGKNGKIDLVKVRPAPHRLMKTQTQVTTVVVNFTDIGQRQTIKPPPHSIPVYGRG